MRMLLPLELSPLDPRYETEDKGQLRSERHSQDFQGKYPHKEQET